MGWPIGESGEYESIVGILQNRSLTIMDLHHAKSQKAVLIDASVRI